jgi:hypothetical protein
MKRAQLLKPIGGRGAILGSWTEEEPVAARALRRRAERDAILEKGSRIPWKRLVSESAYEEFSKAE